MAKVSIIGLDLAKQVFQVRGVDEAGEVVVRRRLWRAQVVRYFGKLAPSLVGMTARGRTCRSSRGRSSSTWAI